MHWNPPQYIRVPRPRSARFAGKGQVGNIRSGFPRSEFGIALWLAIGLALLPAAPGAAQLPPASTPSNDLRITRPPTLEAEGWRVEWTAVPGRTYLLQRWHNDNLGDPGQPSWVEVGRVVATGATASLVDGSVSLSNRRFYRVLEQTGTPPDGDAIIRLESPLRTPGGGWRITWSSTPFRTYQLQRWNGETLPVPGDPGWVAVDDVVALTDRTSVEDGTAGDASSRFYRVMQVASQPPTDGSGPRLSGFRADLLGVSSDATVRLQVHASDPSGVREIVFLADDTVLGRGQSVDGVYTLDVPFAAVGSAGRLVARARDEANNESAAAVAPPILGNTASRFLALDPEGRPVPGSSVALTRDVPLPAIEFRPGAAFGAGAEQTLVVRFAPGAQLATSGARDVLRFQDAELRFGRDSTLQFGDLGVANPAGRVLQGRAGRMQVTHQDGAIRILSEQPLELPTSALTPADLEPVLGLQPGEGIPVQLFEQFPLRWHAGVLEDAGIRAGRFSFDGLPLPALSGEYPEFLVRFDTHGEFRLPFYGTFSWPDGTSTPPEVSLGPQDPGWLVLRADGSIAWHNRSRVRLPGGTSFRADIVLDDPVYRLEVFADGVQVPLIGSLAAFLPGDPGLCLPAGNDPAALAAASQCLMAFDRAFWNFSASAVAASADLPTTATAVPASPPDDVETALSLLEAWTYRGLAPLSTPMPLGSIRELLAHTAASASAATDLRTVMNHRLALARVAAAVASGNLTASAEDLAALDAALAETRTAVLNRAGDPGAIAQFSSLRATLVAAAEARQLLVTANRPEDAAVSVALGDLVQDFLVWHLDRLGIVNGDFTPENNPIVRGMNRFVAVQHLQDLVQTLSSVAQLGAADRVFALQDEALTQIALRLWELLETVLDDSEQRGDIAGFQFALEDLLDLAAFRRLPFFPGRTELTVIPQGSTPAWGALLSRLEALYVAELQRPYPERSLLKETIQWRRLIRILSERGSLPNFGPEPFARAHAGVGDQLRVAMDRVPFTTSLDELVTLLEAGMVHEGLRRHFGFAATANWEGERLPIVVNRLAEVAVPQRAWSELHRAAELLRREADRFGASNDSARRRLYLQQCVPVLNAARSTAVVIWEAEQARRAVASPIDFADIVLPGGLSVEKAVAAAQFNRRSGEFSGAFKGALRLPKLDARLEIVGASFTSAGEFDVTARGSLALPTSEPVHGISIPARHPLHVRFRAPDDLQFSGGLRFTMKNGVEFTGFMALEEPLYTFGLSAQSLRLDLADQAILFRPTLPAAGVFTDEVATALNEYFLSLGASLEPLAGLTDPLDVQAPGSAPGFQQPQASFEFDAVSAWANAIRSDAALNVQRSYAASLAPLRGVAGVAASHLRETRATLSNLVVSLDGTAAHRARVLRSAQALRQIAEALERKSELGEPIGLSEFATSLEGQRLRDEVRTQIHDLMDDELGNRDLKRARETLRAAFDFDAAEQLLDQPSTVQPRIPAFLDRMERNLALQYGFDPATGSLTNTTVLGAFSRRELQGVVVQLIEFESERALLGAPPPSPTYRVLLRNLVVYMRERAIADLRSTPELDWEGRTQILELLTELEVLAELGLFTWPTEVQHLDGTRGPHPGFAVEAGALLTLAESAEARKVAFSTRTPREPLDALRRLLLRLDAIAPRHIQETLLPAIRADFQRALAGWEVVASQPLPLESLRLALSAVDGLTTLALAAEQWGLDTEAARVRDGILPNLTDRFTPAAEAQKAWWHLGEYTRRLLVASRTRLGTTPTALQQACLAAATRTVRSADRLSQALILLRPSFEPLDLKLPGGLEVRRVHGTVFYNRETEVLGGSFGGRLEFSNLEKAFFEIVQARIATDGSFTLQAATAGPLFFGGLQLATTLDVVGGDFGLTSVLGTGQLTVPLNTTTQIFNVTAGYDVPTQRLRFDTTGTALDWKISDDLVLFNGGFGLDLSLAEPAGALRFNGSAGLFARQSPLPATLSRTNFHLMVTNAAIQMALSETGFSASLTNGTLLLPEFFRASLCTTNRILTNYLASAQGTNSVLTNFVSLAAVASPTTPPAGTYGSAISLSRTNPIALAVTFDPLSIAFSGEVQFRDLGFQVPDFETVELAVCNARLVFPTNTLSSPANVALASNDGRPMFQPNRLPYLTNFYGALQFPLPGQTNILEVVDAAWALNGYPSGTIRLRTDLDLFNLDAWRLTLLGAGDSLCASGTGLTIGRQTNGAPFLGVDAGVEFGAPLSLFSDEQGAALSAAACGSLRVPFGEAPQVLVNSLAISNRLVRLGGTNGVTLTNMVLRLEGLTNLFNPTPQAPLLAALTGSVVVGPGSGLGLSNAVFRFEGGLLPRFSVSELAVLQPGAIFGLNEYLPMTLEEGRLRFLTPDLPLPQLFSFTNLATILSGSVALPPGPEPVLGGRVRDLMVTFLPNGLPQVSLDAVGFTVDLTALIGDDLPLTLGGQLYIGGLQDPPNFLFSGKLRGNYKGNAIEGLVALDPCGLRGVCFGLAGAEVSIPLAYGFVLTGAKGGLSFVNSNANPCEFMNYLPIDPVSGRPLGGGACRFEIPTNCPPAITLAEFQDRQRGRGRQAAAQPSVASFVPWTPVPASLDGGDGALFADARPNIVPRLLSQSVPEPFPCPGDCPPASVNIFCMPHPDHDVSGSPHTNRVIMKFSAIDEPTLNLLGVTPELIASLVPDFAADRKAVAMDIAGTLRQFVSLATPRPPAGAPDFVQQTAALIETRLDEMALAFANGIHCATAPIPSSGAEAAALLYDAIRDTAWAGVPCPDVTVLLQGSVSYTGVSAFANVSGGVVLSSTGSAGVIGAVNVFGMPVGTARVFVNQTDENGNPSPSLCGQVNLGIGPLQLGGLSAIEDCPGCFDEFVATFNSLAGVLGNTYVYEVMLRTAPELADPSLSAVEHLARLNTPDLQSGFVAAVFQTPPADSEGRVAPAFIDFLANLANAYQPRLAMCGEVNPKLFGFSLTGGNRLLSGRFHAGPNYLAGVPQDDYLMFAEYGFSPSQMFAYTLLSPLGGSGAIAAMFAPALDEATASTTLRLPPLGDLVRETFERSPVEIAADRFDDFLSDAVTTFTYRLAPLGLELGRASGRILMPSLEHHPRGPNPRTAPDERGQGFPDRLEVLLAALGDKDQTNAVNRLGDGTWKGEGNADFQTLFAGSPYETAVAGQNLSLRDDYFPHGGFLGAGTLDFPKILAEPLPESLFTALDADAPVTERLAALQDLFFNRLLATDRVGEVAFYLPAPNPPVAQIPTDAREFAEVFRNFLPEDPLQFSTYYPLDRAFLSGWLDTPILGIPTVRSQVSWQPREGVFRLEAEVPVNSWFNRLIGSARWVVDMRNNPAAADPLLVSFLPMSNQVARLEPRLPTLARDLEALTATLPQRLAAGLPKVSMELTGNRVRIPVPTYVPTAPLTPAQTVATIDDALFAAYSPFFEMRGANGNNPVALAQRRGGVAIRGDFNFLNGTVVVDNAEFSVTPSPQALALPSLNASLAGGTVRIFGFTLNPAAGAGVSLLAANPPRQPTGPTLEFESNAQRVRLAAQGSIPSFDLGPALQVQALNGDVILASAVFETRGASLPQGSLALGPAQLRSPLFAPGATLRIHGATPSAPFTYSSEGPWSANVTLEGAATLDLQSGGDRILRLQPSQVLSASVGRDVRGVTRLTLNLRSGTALTAFPGTSFQQTFALNAVTALTLSSEGSLALDGAINALTIGGVSLEGRVSLRNEPELRFALGGTAVLPPLGGLRIESRTPRTPLGGEWIVQRTGATLGSSLRIRPARLTFESALGAGFGFLMDGGSSNQDFTFSTSAPWSARLLLAGNAPLILRSGGVTALSTEAASIQSASVSRDAQGGVAIAMNLAARASWLAYPNLPLAPNLTLGSTGVLRLASDGDFLLTGTTGAGFLLGNRGLPVATMNSGASIRFAPRGLTLEGVVTGGVLSQVAPAVNVTGAFTLSPSGQVGITGSATIQPIADTPFRIESSTGGNLSAALNNNGLTFSAARLRVNGIFSTVVTLPTFTIPDTGNFTRTVSPPNLSIAGIPCASISFTLRRNSGQLSLDPFAANLNLPGFNQRITGTINSAGSVALDYSGGLNLGGFAASNGTLGLRNSGLTATGTFVVRYANTTFGSVTFSGSVNSSGGYSLARTSGGISLGGIAIPSPNLTLGTAGVSGSAVLPFGAISAPLSGLAISAANGLTFSPYTHSVDSGWIQFVDVPLTDIGDAYSRARGGVRFAPSGGTSFTTTLNFTWAGWIVFEECVDPEPLNPLNPLDCTTRFAPSNINSVSAPPRFSGSGSIGSNGQFTISTVFGGLSSFAFDFW